MKLVIAQMKHETNTHSPEGAAAVAAYRGTGSANAASAWPSGPVAPLATSMARAQALAAATPAASGPVVLLDHSDHCASGGTMDTMTVLGAILDAGRHGVAAFAGFDPAAVQQMVQAGVGATLTLRLGGKLDMPAIGLAGQPRSVTGRVKRLCVGLYRNQGPMARRPALNRPCGGGLRRQGVCTADYAALDLAHVRRPIYPLDAM